jgi:hypothetical protein
LFIFSLVKIFHKRSVLARGKTVAAALFEDGRREADMLLQLRHDAIVSLHAFLETPQHLVGCFLLCSL